MRWIRFSFYCFYYGYMVLENNSFYIKISFLSNNYRSLSIWYRVYPLFSWLLFYSKLFLICFLKLFFEKRFNNNICPRLITFKLFYRNSFKLFFPYYVLNTFPYHYSANMISLTYCKIQYLYPPLFSLELYSFKNVLNTVSNCDTFFYLVKEEPMNIYCKWH